MSIPRWAYKRGHVNACSMSEAIHEASQAMQSAGIAAGKVTVDKEVVRGHDANTGAIVFLLSSGSSIHADVMTFGHAPEDLRDAIWKHISSHQSVDCGSNLNPV